MTDTLNEIRNNLLFACAFCFTVIGVLLYAPTVSATDAEIYNSQFENICNHYRLNKEEYVFLGTTYFRGGQIQENRMIVIVAPREFLSSQTSYFNVRCRGGIHGNDVGCEFYWQPARSDIHYYAYDSGTSSYWDSNGFTSFTFYGILGNINGWRVPFDWYGNMDYEKVAFTNGNNNYTLEQLVDYTQASSPLANISVNNFDSMMIDYLKQKGLDVVGARLVDDNGVTIKKLPIASDWQDLVNDDYSGLYCQSIPHDDYYEFALSRTPDYSASELAPYYDAFLTIDFSPITYFTSFTTLIGCDYDVYPPDPHYLPYTIGGNKLIRGFMRLYNDVGNEQTENFSVSQRWRWFNNSAIPRPITSHMYVSFNFEHYVQDPDTGDVEDVDGKQSDEYKDYYEKYTKEMYDLLGRTLNGVIYGRTTFDGDWRGQNVNTEIIYSADDYFQIDDDEVTADILSSFFELGDGILLELSIGVLSIAFASYILFGKH